MSPDGTSSESPESSEGIVQKATPNFIRRSFALKFGIVLLVLGLSVASIGLGATQHLRSETQDNVREEYSQVALQEADIIEQWTTRNRLSTKLISSHTEFSQNDGVRNALRNERSELPADVQSMHVISSTLSGTSVVASTSLEAGTNVTSVNRGWTKNQSFHDRSAVKLSTVYDAGGEPVVGFLSLVAGSDNRYLLVEYNLETIAQSLQGTNRADGGFTQVVNSTGTVMIDEPRSERQTLGDDVLQSYSNGDADGPIERANELRESTASAGVASEMEPNPDVIDETYTVGYAPVDGSDWVVLVHAPYSSVFGFVQQIQRWGIIATIGGLVLIGGIGATLGYSTSSTIDRLTRKAEQMREGNLDGDITSSRIDNLGRLYVSFADMRDSLRNQIDEADRARKEAEVSRAEAMEMNNYLEEKADEFSRAMVATAGGDMTQRMQTDGENESMDRIATEFNAMIEELEKTTGQLKRFAEEVAQSGDIVLASAESMRDASEQVAGSIQEISDAAVSQEERLQRISTDIDDLVATLEQFQETHQSVEFGDAIEQFRDVATNGQEVAQASEETKAEAENVAGAAEEQAAELNEVSARANRLKRYAQPLGDILDRFETEAEHEFVFSDGPSQTARDDDSD